MSARKLRLAQKMYANPTRSESALWERLKGNRLGVTFLFQELVLGYIADFYCSAARLIVEVDGPVHQTAQQLDKDAIKDRALRWHGFVVLRLPTTITTDEMVERIERKLLFLQVKRQSHGSQQEESKPAA
jgi:very-short-patch-repair endonuclease